MKLIDFVKETLNEDVFTNRTTKGHVGFRDKNGGGITRASTSSSVDIPTYYKKYFDGKTKELVKRAIEEPEISNIINNENATREDSETVNAAIQRVLSRTGYIKIVNDAVKNAKMYLDKLLKNKDPEKQEDVNKEIDEYVKMAAEFIAIKAERSALMKKSFKNTFDEFSSKLKIDDVLKKSNEEKVEWLFSSAVKQDKRTMVNPTNLSNSVIRTAFTSIYNFYAGDKLFDAIHERASNRAKSQRKKTPVHLRKDPEKKNPFADRVSKYIR